MKKALKIIPILMLIVLFTSVHIFANDALNGFYLLENSDNVTIKAISSKGEEVSLRKVDANGDSNDELFYAASDALEVTVNGNSSEYVVALTSKDGLSSTNPDIFYMNIHNGNSTFTIYPKIPSSSTDMLLSIESEQEEFKIYLGYAKNVQLFKDVADNAWYKDSIMWAIDVGITNGTSDANFSPLDDCNKAQVITFLWRAVGKPSSNAAAETVFYNDMTADWYKDAISWAYENGIADGEEPHSFGVSTPITRAEFVTCLWKAAGKPETKATTCKFEDVKADGDSLKAIIWASEAGITDGVSATQFAPDNICNRAHIVTFLERHFNK